MKKRKVAALLILALGITGSLFINSSAGSNDSRTNPDYQAINAERLDYAKGASGNESIGGGEEINPAANITETVAGIYLEGFFQKNQNLLGNPEALSEKLNFDLSDLAIPENMERTVIAFNLFEKGSFPITADTGPAAQMAYLEKIGELMEKNLSSIDGNITEIIDSWLDEKNPRPLENYIESARQQISDLQKISVPANWEQFHLQNLNLWQKKIAVYETVLESGSDPLKAYVAVQMMPDIAKENDSLQKIISEKYELLDKDR